MAEPLLQLVSEIGAQLGRPARPNKDFLVKSLRQAASALSQIEQSSLHEASKKAESVKRLEVAIRPLTKSLIKHGLFRHNDKDVRLMVAICVSEIFRVLAPEPPFEDKYLRDIFKLILSMFAELGDTDSPYFSSRVKILESVARCKCFVVMLDIDCNDLVLEMFNIFFSVVRDNHLKTLIDDLLSIMTHILQEEASQALSDVILRNLIKEGTTDESSAASKLAVSVIESCAEKLEPFICGFLTSCSLDRDAFESELKEFYHEILFKVFKCAPQMLLAVIPNLIRELLTDQVDVRIKAVNLSGKLFAMPEQRVAQKYHNLFLEFKNRFSDISVDVRLSVLRSAKDCYMENPLGKESPELLSAIEGRLLDFDERVRTLAVVVVCDLAMFNLKVFPPELISKATERLRDKKLSVRKKAFQKLIEVYQKYCKKCSKGKLTMDDHFEQIPCKILMLCYDKDCKDFRSQNMELILAERLFPVRLLAENRTIHWIHFSSLFTPLHVKALNSILSQKRRLQIEMQSYLALRKKQKGNSSEEMQMRNRSSFLKMSASFPDPSKAEEGFDKLNQMKDNNIFIMLESLLVDQTSINAQTTRDKFLKMIGVKHPQFEFLQQLSSKCSFNIFCLENVTCIMDRLSSRVLGNEQLEASSAKLLLAIVSFFPSLLRGSEKQLRSLLVEKNLIDDVLMEIFAKASSHISVNFRDFYPFLARVCKEGTRVQSKHAVKAIASLTSEPLILSELCKELVDSLDRGRNVPTILQSLGCIAQHSVSAFEAHEREINSYIFNRIFQVEQSDISSDVTSDRSHSCRLKIYGLKTLVKSFLPFRGSRVNPQIDDLFDVVLKLLQVGDHIDGISCESDIPHIRLAAAKSVLRLSRKWDLHVSPEIFRRTVLMVKDYSSSVRSSFLNKTYKLLKEHSLPLRYACVLALAASGSKDLQDISRKYLEEFIKDYSKKAGNHQTSTVEEGSLTNYPAYTVVFLVHILAHDNGFPPQDCEDEKAYTYFCSPLFWVVRGLLNAHVVDGNLDLVNDTAVYLLSIFSAIKKAEDAEDASQTLKLQILAEVGIGIVFALNNNCNSSSSAPERIFLPKSLYKLSSVKKSDEEKVKFPSQSFVKRVVDCLRSQVTMPASSLRKRGRKCQDTSSKNANTSRNETTETRKPPTQDTDLRSRQENSVSKDQPIIKEKNCASKDQLITKEKNSSPCYSAITTPLCESQVLVQNVVRLAPAFEENGRVDSTISSESSKHSTAKVNEQCCARVCSTENDPLVGKRIKIFSPIDRCFCSGTVIDFDPGNSVHKISYDSGDVELLCLDSESWETIGETFPTEKILSSQEMKLADESNTFRSTDCSAEGTVDGTGDDVVVLSEEVDNKEKEKKIHNGKAAKRKKVQKLSSDTSASELTNVNEETFVRRSQRLRKV